GPRHWVPSSNGTIFISLAVSRSLFLQNSFHPIIPQLHSFPPWLHLLRASWSGLLVPCSSADWVTSSDVNIRLWLRCWSWDWLPVPSDWFRVTKPSVLRHPLLCCCCDCCKGWPWEVNMVGRRPMWQSIQSRISGDTVHRGFKRRPRLACLFRWRSLCLPKAVCLPKLLTTGVGGCRSLFRRLWWWFPILSAATWMNRHCLRRPKAKGKRRQTLCANHLVKGITSSLCCLRYLALPWAKGLYGTPDSSMHCRFSRMYATWILIKRIT